MQYIALLFGSLLLAVASQNAEWHFSWDESKKWNALRDSKIVETKKIMEAKEGGAQINLLDSGGTEGSNLIGGLPVYVSLTTISKRLHLLGPTIQSIIAGSVVPTMIYVFISKDPHLIDTGIKEEEIMDESMKLVDLLDFFHNIKFVFTENIGPHRKVLPLLHHKWEEDCVIISVDDDHIYLHHWLRDMLAYYVHSKGQAIISTRARRIAICSGQAPFSIAPYMHAIGAAYHTQWYEAAPHVHEMLLLPTGVGGVLYRPRFFNHSVAFSRELFALTLRADDLTFRLATLANGISVYTACVHGDFKDNHLITSCPPLSDVGFQHLARRTTEINVYPTGSHSHAHVRSHSGSNSESDEDLYGDQEGSEHRDHDGHGTGEGDGHHHRDHEDRDHDSGSAESHGEDSAEADAEEPDGPNEAPSSEESGGHHLYLRRRTSHRYSMYRPNHKRKHDSPITWMRNLHDNNATTSADLLTGAVRPFGSGSSNAGPGPGQGQGQGHGNDSHSHNSGFNSGTIATGAGRANLTQIEVPDVSVYNRSKLLLAASIKVPTKNIDHGKEGSLSSINSKHDGNFHQWNKATELLRKKGLFDVDVFIQKYVVKERRSCVATGLLLNYDNSTWTGSFVGAFATQWQLVHENWSNDRCGVVACKR